MNSQHCVYYTRFCRGQGEGEDKNFIEHRGKKDLLERTDLGKDTDGLPGPSVLSTI